MPITLNPMDGCEQCTWHSERGEVHLLKPCSLHEAIAELQNDHAVEREITKQYHEPIERALRQAFPQFQDDERAIPPEEILQLGREYSEMAMKDDGK